MSLMLDTFLDFPLCLTSKQMNGAKLTKKPGKIKIEIPVYNEDKHIFYVDDNLKMIIKKASPSHPALSKIAQLVACLLERKVTDTESTLPLSPYSKQTQYILLTLLDTIRLRQIGEFTIIPNEITEMILRHLHPVNRRNVMRTCKLWSYLVNTMPQIIKGPEAWAKELEYRVTGPQLPENWQKVMAERCPFNPTLQVKETHTLVLVPSSIDNIEQASPEGVKKDLCLDSFKECERSEDYKTIKEKGLTVPAQTSFSWALMIKTNSILISELYKSEKGEYKFKWKEHKDYEKAGIVEAAIFHLFNEEKEIIKTGSFSASGKLNDIYIIPKEGNHFSLKIKEVNFWERDNNIDYVFLRRLE